MQGRVTGAYERTSVLDEEVTAFVPAPLPPTDPPLQLDGALADQLLAAEVALARLQLAANMVPSVQWFMYGFVRKEAVLSSQIEGTQATLVDLLNFEASGPGDAPDADVEEICNYLDALSYAREQMASPDGLPLSMRLLNETHRRLLAGARGADKKPGEIRRTQNWIGGSRPGNAVFVPPPPHRLGSLLSAFENYVHADSDLSPIVRAGLIHVQFETIHPYLDGNGRIGRLLVGLLFEQWGLLKEPLLYLSLYFKQHRNEYYDRLDGVRTNGDWEAWLSYFATAVATVADEAVASATDLFALLTGDRARVLGAASTSVAAIRLFELLPTHPIVSVARTQELLDVSKPTAGRAIGSLESASVLVETTGRRRDRSWAYAGYLERLKGGTELP